MPSEVSASSSSTMPTQAQTPGAEADKDRPGWTFGLTRDSPLMVFCPHYYDKKNETADASATVDTQRTPRTAAVSTLSNDSNSLDIQMSPEMAEKALAGGCPVVHRSSTVASPQEEQRQDKDKVQINPDNNMLIEEKQKPSPGQHTPLPTSRRMSTIPKSGYNPGHQDPTKEKWEYPSQQMFYNAMKRKGHSPSEEEMSTIVGMHNAVNERTWQLLLNWEQELHPETVGSVRLKKFSGDATKYTPKARFLNLFGRELPFDRHDWIIERADNEDVHYVIDYYNGASTNTRTGLGLTIDVRPALDSPGNFIDRAKMIVHKLTNRASRQFGAMGFPSPAPQTESQGTPANESYEKRRWGHL